MPLSRNDLLVMLKTLKRVTPSNIENLLGAPVANGRPPLRLYPSTVELVVRSEEKDRTLVALTQAIHHLSAGMSLLKSEEIKLFQKFIQFVSQSSLVQGENEHVNNLKQSIADAQNKMNPKVQPNEAAIHRSPTKAKPPEKQDGDFLQRHQHRLEQAKKFEIKINELLKSVPMMKVSSHQVLENRYYPKSPKGAKQGLTEQGIGYPLERKTFFNLPANPGSLVKVSEAAQDAKLFLLTSLQKKYVYLMKDIGNDLMQAIQAKDKGKIETIVKSDGHGFKPFFASINFKDKDTVIEILDAVESAQRHTRTNLLRDMLSVCDRSGNNCFMLAVLAESKPIYTHLTSLEVTSLTTALLTQNKAGDNALMIAIQKKNIGLVYEIMKGLMPNRSDQYMETAMTQQNAQGDNAMMMAAKNGDMATLKILLDLPSAILEQAFKQKNNNGDDVAALLKSHPIIAVGELLEDPRVTKLDLPARSPSSRV